MKIREAIARFIFPEIFEEFKSLKQNYDFEVRNSEEDKIYYSSVADEATLLRMENSDLRAKIEAMSNMLKLSNPQSLEGTVQYYTWSKLRGPVYINSDGFVFAEIKEPKEEK